MRQSKFVRYGKLVKNLVANWQEQERKIKKQAAANAAGDEVARKDHGLSKEEFKDK